MVAVREVQVPVHQIADVIAMRDRLVPTAGAMHMPGGVSAAGMRRRAGRRIAGGHFDAVLVDVIAMHVVQMPIVQVVHVIAMLDGRMPAIGPVNVAVIVMLGVLAFGHRLLLLRVIV